jgi:CheY-like chemotaxis protein
MRTVLVVDDEFGIAEVLAEILGDAGYRVLTAIHGRQALERIAETRPDVILLDFMMPVLNGPGTLAALAADPACRDIPVIMMSSLPEGNVAERASGYAAFLRKPFKAAAVLEAIARELGRPKRGGPTPEGGNGR